MDRNADEADSSATALWYQNEGGHPEFSIATTITRFQRPIVSRNEKSYGKNQSTISYLLSHEELVAFLEQKPTTRAIINTIFVAPSKNKSHP
jgi:hypothetical protein